MKFLKQAYNYTHEVKQSKFIAHLVPYSLYEDTLTQLKSQHPKARHFVTAFRYLNEFDQIVEHSSDDGEPKGTSGKPSLFVLQGAAMINSGVIIVRYFGGTKLGTGGLVRAYSDAVNSVLEMAAVFEYKKEIIKEISFEYTNLRMLDYEIKEFNIEIVEKLFDTKTIYIIKSDEITMYKFFNKLDRIIKISDLTKT